MSDNQTDQHARAIAGRIDPTIVGFFDPFTLIMVLCSVLGFLMQCWSFYHATSTEADLQAELKFQCSKPGGRERIARRMTKQIKRKSREPLTKGQARVIAEATIDHALEVPAEQMRSYAAVCGRIAEHEYQHIVGDDDE